MGAQYIHNKWRNPAYSLASQLNLFPPEGPKDANPFSQLPIIRSIDTGWDFENLFFL